MVLTSIGIIDDQRVLGNPVVDCYTSGTSTWCKCPGAQAVGIIVIGGGGGGGDSTNTSTVGCATYQWAGGGGGGGGGISSCLYVSSCINDTATITVGAGGNRGIPATVGGDSCFCGGMNLCAQGGRQGQFSTTCNSTNSNGGAGGLGTTINGNAGGAGRATSNGIAACNTAGTTRAGGGGGGARYCNVIPTSVCLTNSGADSSAKSYDAGWACIDLNTFGKGGKGGDASMDFARSVLGTGGDSGLVYIVQYF